ncbi:uncharacterized protein Z518_03926 [Rhinocladiella mackenziei CBS 650.93]|uniref:Anaphase-promoting complex subunit 2 n=1 Tax=Rhinocladiella mackenziei CBS 650.93 TaxID=1442369 RepID=A0A0D2FV32_9EURO|nr:uncharacterized protein Z518_03926 [Rhinocladiella mackenziei CBS 650.93]KIX05952.1 hypothetical protein Z518_03926 [Rhinocladiella mackenziei CBS 650.93]
MSQKQNLASDSSPGGGVFASVFSPSGIKPPQHRQRFTPAATLTIPDIRTALHAHLKLLLGIEDKDFVYGINRWVSDAGGPFHSHFESSPPADQIRRPTPADHKFQNSKEAKSSVWSDLVRWRSVIGTETVKKLLAAVLNDLMTEFITWSYAGVYLEHLHIHLEFWMEHLFARVAHKAVCTLDDHPRGTPFPETELKKWKDMATARLGALRVDELFEIIVDWDNTAPAIEDLRRFTTNPATRGYLTHNFADVLQTRLLHPGASTIEIIQLYISIIRSFRILDPKGVLLDRVTRKIRRYLRERDDTVRVIVTGLLSDTVSENGELSGPDPETLTELATELGRHNTGNGAADDSEFEWDNMDWVPDPVDAAPDYVKSTNTDVIGSLITLFETKDVFVKELQSSLADRLLKNKPDFNHEIGVLEHLKIRFGDSTLQGCEVMLRDVLDSRKVDNVIHRDQDRQDAQGRPLRGDDVQLRAKILSRLFWPSMPEQSFKVPQTVLEQQQNYERGFEALKQSRKLTWLNAVGQVEVELELEDRFYHDEVLPWQAAVIYAFQDEGATAGPPIQKSVKELASDLSMSPTLVRSACIFWMSKRILIETSKDTFCVLEKLPDGNGDTVMNEDSSASARPAVAATAASAAAEAAAAQATKEAEEAERKQKMATYHQFIISMLTNQGAVPLPRIAMMLGIVVPGGFPFSNEELKEFLAGMIKEGILDVGHGGNYKIAS